MNLIQVDSDRDEFTTNVQLTPPNNNLAVGKVLEPIATKEMKNYKESETIFSAQKEVKGIYRVLHGSVKFGIQDKKLRGRNSSEYFITSLFSKGDFFGHHFLIPGLPNQFYAEALQDTVTEYYSLEQFAKQNPELKSQIFMQAIEQNYKEKIDKQKFYLASVHERIAFTLIQLAERFGTKNEAGEIVIDVKLTRSEIAQMAGTINESLSRHLTELKGEGIIELKGKRILIKNLTILNEKSGELLAKKQEPTATT